MTSKRSYTCVLLFGALTQLLLCQSPARQVVQSSSGSITFESPTNMPGVEVKGKSTALSVRMEITRDSGKLLLHAVDAHVPVKSLITGMKMRDEHMRQYIFRTSDGQEPDLRFTAGDGVCEKGTGNQELVCNVPGELTVRGVAKPAAITVKAKEEGSDAFKASADLIVKLSTYGIPQPSQFGVKPADEVKIHLDFTAKARPVDTARVGR